MYLLIKASRSLNVMSRAAVLENGAQILKRPFEGMKQKIWIKKLVLIPSVSVWVNTLQRKPKEKTQKTANIFIAELSLCKYPRGLYLILAWPFILIH